MNQPWLAWDEKYARWQAWAMIDGRRVLVGQHPDKGPLVQALLSSGWTRVHTKEAPHA